MDRLHFATFSVISCFAPICSLGSDVRVVHFAAETTAAGDGRPLQHADMFIGSPVASRRD